MSSVIFEKLICLIVIVGIVVSMVIRATKSGDGGEVDKNEDRLGDDREDNFWGS